VGSGELVDELHPPSIKPNAAKRAKRKTVRFICRGSFMRKGLICLLADKEIKPYADLAPVRFSLTGNKIDLSNKNDNS